MADQEVLNRFIEKRPLAVMTRLVLGEVFQEQELSECILAEESSR